METDQPDKYLAQLFNPDSERIPLFERSLQNVMEVPFERLRQLIQMKADPVRLLTTAFEQGETLVRWWLSRKQVLDESIPNDAPKGSCDIDDGGKIAIVRGHSDFKHGEFKDGVDTITLTYSRKSLSGRLYVGRWTNTNHLDLLAARPKISVTRNPNDPLMHMYTEYTFTMYGDTPQNLLERTIRRGEGVVSQRFAIPIPGYNLSPQI